MVSNEGPSAYQPNALPLGQTGSEFWQNDPNCLNTTAGTWGGMNAEVRVSTESWLLRLNSHATPARNEIRDLFIVSLAFYR